MARSHRLVGVVLSLFVVAGCGSTVTLRAGQSTTSQAGSELGGNGATANGGAANGLTNAGGGPSGAPTGGLNGGGTGTAATGSVASSSGSVSAGSTQVSVRGINSSAVTVGAVYFNTDNVNNLNPAAPQQAGSGQIEQRAVAAYINSHGGIAGGRKIQLVEHEINVQDEPATQAQSACADFTQDHHVYAVVGQSASAFVSCLAPQHVLTIAASVDAGTQTDFAKSNNTYWAPTSMETVAAGAAEIEEMHRSGWLKAGAKIGFVAFDAPEYHEQYDKALVPGLKSYGFSFAETEWIPYTDLANYGNTLAQIQSAALKMRANGITNILFGDSNGAGAYYFIKQADSQHYYPLYAFDSDTGAGSMAAQFGPTDLHGSVAVGWIPTWDEWTGKLYNSQAVLCDKIMRAAGQTPANDSDHELQQAICSQFFFLRDAMAHLTDFTVAGFTKAAEGLGNNQDSAAHGLSDVYASGKHWGAAYYRDLTYADSCNCYRYGAQHAIGS